MTNLFSFSETPLLGTVSLPGDKSLSHRAALFAALAEGDSRIDNFLVSGVTHAMLDALTNLGVEWKLENQTLLVKGRGISGLQAPAKPIDCGNSATTMRLLAGALAVAGIPAVLDGSAGLRRRPMERIVDPLKRMGVAISAEKGFAPIRFVPSRFPLKALNATLPVASAQVKTCLLLAALAGDGPTVVREPARSRDHTERMLTSMGITITSTVQHMSGQTWYETRLVPPRPLTLSPLNLTLPGDFSSAAFLIVAALIVPGSEITLQGIGLNSGRTGLLDVLLSMGANIRISRQAVFGGEPVGDITIKSSNLSGVEVRGEQVVRMIDEMPIFSVAAAYAKGITTVRDASELRVKESDRISSLSQELRKLGVAVEEKLDGFIISGGHPVSGGTVEPHGDHRLAMSLAAVGLAAQSPVQVQGAEIIAESFPEFTGILQGLGAGLKVEEGV
jgi:3-phosphoshikimate 1-carboxyvinyltransferase